MHTYMNYRKYSFIRKGVDCVVFVFCIAMNWVCSLVLKKSNDNRQLNAAVKTSIRFDKTSSRGCFFYLMVVELTEIELSRNSWHINTHFWGSRNIVVLTSHVTKQACTAFRVEDITNIARRVSRLTRGKAA